MENETIKPIDRDNIEISKVITQKFNKALLLQRKETLSKVIGDIDKILENFK